MLTLGEFTDDIYLGFNIIFDDMYDEWEELSNFS